jgi:protein CpxP
MGPARFSGSKVGSVQIFPEWEEHRIMMKFEKVNLLARRALLLAGILAASCGALYVRADGQAPGGMRQHGGGIERQMSELTQVLALTPDQQALIRNLLVLRQQKMAALRESGTQPTFDQILAMRKESNEKIKAVLTEDQRAKFAAWQQQRMGQRPGPGGEGAPAPAPTPAPPPEPPPAPQPPSF